VKALIGIAVLAIASVIALVVMSAPAAVKMEPAVTTVGITTPVKVVAGGPHGIRRVAASIEQEGQRYPLFEQTFPSRRVFFFTGKAAPLSFTFEAGKTKAPKLKDGKARIVVEVVSNDLMGKTSQAAADVLVVTAPPRVAADDYQHYVNQGGMEMATLIASGSWSEAGVRVGKYTFRSFPLPGHPANERFSLFAYPWDLSDSEIPSVYARNAAGTEASAKFWFKLFPKKFRTRDLEIDDKFLDKVVNQIDPGSPGDLLQRFLRINGEMRRKNNQQLADLRLKTEEKRLWNGPFIHYGKEESMFADVRNYIYKGKKVDQQVHLGFDLSDVQNAPVNSANDGRVVWASDLGIYGNCIVVDHGYGLQSIYGHLFRIDVKVGDMVKKDQTMGVAGATGLAGGVHVHFSMQVDGVQINPREWWDEHWIRDRVLSKLEPGQTSPSQAEKAPAQPRKAKAHARRKRR
jgi:murein DD-endopeptidase MepM/ murein hydrolase activator NlpD